MRFDNIHYTQQQVRGGHIGTRNNVFIEQNNYIMKGPEPPKMNFFQGLLTGLTGGSIFGGFGMGGMFGGCGMPGMFGGCGMGSIFGGFGMGGFSPFGLGCFGMQGGAQGIASTATTPQSDAQSLAGLQKIYSDYKIAQTGDGKYTVRDKYGNEEIILSNASLDEIADELATRNNKDGAGKRAADIKAADTAKQNKKATTLGIVKEGDKWVKKSAGGKVEKEYTWDSKTETFEEKLVAAKPKQSENEES